MHANVADHCRFGVPHGVVVGTRRWAARGLAGHPRTARAAFERLKALAGTWEGRSTKGWDETLRYEVIAGGSVVLETSVDAHPGETMATAFHMDGDRLMLTHYCVARNQPRLVATSFEDGGRTVVFTFRDGRTSRHAIADTWTGGLSLREAGPGDVTLEVVSGRGGEVDGGDRADSAPEIDEDEDRLALRGFSRAAMRRRSATLTAATRPFCIGSCGR